MQALKIINDLKNRDWLNICICWLNGENEYPVKRNNYNKICLLYWDDFDCTEKNIWKLKNKLNQIEENFSYILEIAFTRDHLIDFINEFNLRNYQDKFSFRAIRVAIRKIEEYGDFLLNTLVFDPHIAIFDKKNKFIIGNAQKIWNNQHIDFYNHYASVKKEFFKGKKNNYDLLGE